MHDLFYPEDVGSKLLRNVRTRVPNFNGQYAH
jgi:hypothetical protein